MDRSERSGRRHCGVLLVFALTGCATGALSESERGLVAGRNADLVRAAEQQVPDIHTAPTAKLWSLCYGYSKLRRYDKLGPCLDQLEKNVAGGDTDGFDVEGFKQRSPFSARHMSIDAKGHASVEGLSLYYDVTPLTAEMRAEYWLDLGEPQKAVTYALKMRPTPPGNMHVYYEIHALGLLAVSSAVAGDRVTGARYAGELETVSTAFPNTLLTTDKLVYLARTYLALGDYERAYRFASQDDRAFFRAYVNIVAGGTSLQGGLFAFEQIPRNFIRNKSALESGHLAEAKAGYLRMVADPATAENGDIYWIILYDLGRISERDGNLPAATDYYEQAVDILELQRATLSTEASKIGFVGNKQRVYRDLIRVLVAQNRDPDAFEYVERAKARALVDMLASKNDIRLRAQDPELARTLSTAAASAESAYRALDTSEEAARRRGLVVQAHAALAHEAPDYASLVTVMPSRAAELQRVLPDGELLLEYYYGEDSSDLFVFTVTRAATRAHRLNADGLTESVRRFRESLQNPRPDSNWQAAAAAAYDRLIRPLGLEGTPRLTIVAHGVLHYVPFNALYDGREPLISRTEIRMLPAAGVLRFVDSQSRPKTKQLLAFGNPDLGQARYNLPFAEAEAKLIASRVSGSRVLLRKEATKTAFIRLAPDFRFVHIASHGAFDPDAPLQSSLYLAPDASSDGVLKVGELYSINVDAELVSLSACETGLGKVAQGDDVVGLTRGFLYAGARSIVASLWEVDDRATAELMTSFYQSVSAGSSKRAALRQAQLKAMKLNPHPFFWAAFQITGAD
jgi:CHAT domain-containing protein